MSIDRNALARQLVNQRRAEGRLDALRAQLDRLDSEPTTGDRAGSQNDPEMTAAIRAALDGLTG